MECKARRLEKRSPRKVTLPVPRHVLAFGAWRTDVNNSNQDERQAKYAGEPNLAQAPPAHQRGQDASGKGDPNHQRQRTKDAIQHPEKAMPPRPHRGHREFYPFASVKAVKAVYRVTAMEILPLRDWRVKRA